jgi:bifunctional DNA-binding transcriptional regulator/antitoxin component of YhaV-PrlF toxin-antitoxin module
MAKMTRMRQVTVSKAITARYGIRPGDEIVPTVSRFI